MRKNKHSLIFISTLFLLLFALMLTACDTPEDDIETNATSSDTTTSADEGDTTEADTTTTAGDTTTTDDDTTAGDDTTTAGDTTTDDDTTTTVEEDNTTADETETETETETEAESEDAPGNDSTGEDEPGEEANTKTYVWIIFEGLNVRSAPDFTDDTNIIGSAKMNDCFVVLERTDAYTKIIYTDSSDDVGYISAKPEYVTFTKPDSAPDPTDTTAPDLGTSDSEESTTTPTEPDTKTYVWVVVDALNIRDNQVLSSGQIIGIAHAGDKFEVLEKADSYTKIVYAEAASGFAYISAKPEYVTFEAPVEVTPIDPSTIKMDVIRKIIYAVETGGQVYGNANYADFTEAGTNTSNEVAITIGAGQWYAGEAKTLLNLIRTTDPELFAQLDTAGIANDLDTANWSTYAISKTSEKAICIQKIIDSEVGHACQDKLVDEQMIAYMNEAKKLGVTDIDALMMCANIRHQGGLSALKRVLEKTTKPYTLDNIYEALATDTGNQVGAYKSRQKMVYESLKTYL